MHGLTAGLVIAAGDLMQEVKSCLRDLRVRVVLEQPGITRWPEFLLSLERARPDVLILDLRSGRLEEAMRSIRTVSPAPVIVVHGSVDAQTLLEALHAGVRDFICPPLQTALRSALERIAGEQAGQETAKGPRGKLLGFLSVKGGCGATTVACHMAAALQQVTQDEILVSDLDMSTGLIGVLMDAKGSYSMVDAAQNVHRLDWTLWKAFVSNGQPRMDVMPAPAEPVLAESLDPKPFREVLRFVRNQYSWVLCDLGRGLSQFSAGLLEEMDEVFVITSPEVMALYRAKKMIQALQKMGFSANSLHLIVNRMTSRCDFRCPELGTMLGLEAAAHLPDASADLEAAYAGGRLLAPGNPLAKRIARLAMKIAGVAEAQPARGLSLFGLRRSAPGLAAAA